MEGLQSLVSTSSLDLDEQQEQLRQTGRDLCRNEFKKWRLRLLQSHLYKYSTRTQEQMILQESSRRMESMSLKHDSVTENGSGGWCVLDVGRWQPSCRQWMQ